MQLRQLANHPLLYRRHFGDDRLREVARVLCTRERQYAGKNPEHVAEDLAYSNDITIHTLVAKFASTRQFMLSQFAIMRFTLLQFLNRIY